jgi:amino acid transporter
MQTRKEFKEEAGEKERAWFLFHFYDVAPSASSLIISLFFSFFLPERLPFLCEPLKWALKLYSRVCSPHVNIYTVAAGNLTVRTVISFQADASSGGFMETKNTEYLVNYPK